MKRARQRRTGGIRIFVLSLCLGICLWVSEPSGLAMGAERSYPEPAVKAPPITLMETRNEIPDWLARWELARVLSYTKRYEEAVTEYEKLLRARPSLTEAQVEKANVLFWMGKQQQALKELEAVPAAAMSDPARVLMADLYSAQKRYDQAETLYRTHLKRHPDDLKVRLKLAEVLSWSKKYDDSLKEYRNILALRPSDIQVRRKFAFVLIWAGKHDEAVRELRGTLD